MVPQNGSSARLVPTVQPSSTLRHRLFGFGAGKEYQKELGNLVAVGSTEGALEHFKRVIHYALVVYVFAQYVYFQCPPPFLMSLK